MQAVIDRIVQYPNRYQLTNVETQEVLGTFDFDEVTGTVQQVGTEINKALFDSIATDLSARVVSNGGELSGTIVTFSDISGTAANVASGDTSATLWGKVKNWFSRLKALAFKNKVAAGDFEAGAIKNADVAADAAISQSKVSGLESALASKANDADLAAIAKSGDLADATQDATHRVVTDTEKETWNAKQNAITGAASTITDDNLTASRALVSDESGKVAVSDVTATELGYLDGVKSNIQEQLDNISSGTGFVSTSPQTLTTEQQAQARENIGAASVAEMNAGDDKSYYNLGAFDTYVDNGDGTVTVTRKTGRYAVNINNFVYESNGNLFQQYIGNLPNGYVGYNATQGGNHSAISNVYPLGDYGQNKTFHVSGDGYLRISDSTYGTDVAQLISALESKGGMYILYETTTSYTETLSANVPLNTLDENMSNIVRDEVEKTLNLCAGIISSNIQSGHTIFSIGTYPAGTYTISVSGTGDDRAYLYRSSTQIGQIPQGGSRTFTLSTEDALSVDVYGAGDTIQVMLVEGSHAYPYQPYNGAIVHEKQLDDALEDYLPLTGGMVNGTINATGQVQEAGQRVYSPNNPQTTITHADNATNADNAKNIIPDENGAVNPLGRKADSVVGESSTALGRDSTASNTSSTALGDSATASGAYSTALGFDTTASGSSSTALGRGATAEGDFSTALGRNSKALGDYSTALGDSAQVFSTDSHTMQLGYSALSALRCKVNLTVTSDKRDKTDIEDITDALAFIERLNPVTFVSNERENYISDEDKKGETFRTYGMCEYDRIAHAAGAKKGERRRCGLLAQEVIATMQEVYGTDNYANIVNDNFHDLAEKPADVENKYTLAYANLVPFLIGAIKELNAKIKELEGETDEDN